MLRTVLAMVLLAMPMLCQDKSQVPLTADYQSPIPANRLYYFVYITADTTGIDTSRVFVIDSLEIQSPGTFEKIVNVDDLPIWFCFFSKAGFVDGNLRLFSPQFSNRTRFLRLPGNVDLSD